MKFKTTTDAKQHQLQINFQSDNIKKKMATNNNIQPFADIRRFHPDSKLHSYLAYRFTGQVTMQQTDYRLPVIILHVTQIIEMDGLYDEENPSIVLCDNFLADALNIPVFHVVDIHKIVSRQLFELPISREWRDHNGFVPYNPIPAEIMDFVRSPISTNPMNINSHALPSWAKPDAIAVKARELLNDNYPPTDFYYVSKELLTAFRTLDGIDKEQLIFQYRDIELMFSGYLEENKENLFDLRHTLIALIRGDVLHDALKVQAFHKHQAVALLRTQLKPFKLIFGPSFPYKEANTYDDPIKPELDEALQTLGLSDNS